jgi:hypothetical protein
VLAGVLYCIESYGKLSDRCYLGAIAFGGGIRGKYKLRYVADGLKDLHRAGVLTYIAGRGRSKPGTVTLPLPQQEEKGGHVPSVFDDDTARGIEKKGGDVPSVFVAAEAVDDARKVRVNRAEKGGQIEPKREGATPSPSREVREIPPPPAPARGLPERWDDALGGVVGVVRAKIPDVWAKLRTAGRESELTELMGCALSGGQSRELVTSELTRSFDGARDPVAVLMKRATDLALAGQAGNGRGHEGSAQAAITHATTIRAQVDAGYMDPTEVPEYIENYYAQKPREELAAAMNAWLHNPAEAAT